VTAENRNHYLSRGFNSKERFNSYWHQQDEILSLFPKKVLEVGIGNGFVSSFIKKSGIEMVTLDIERELAPDITGTVLDLPIKNNVFQVVTCFQVLEHMPYKSMVKALNELYRISNRYVILSLPDVRPVYRINIEFPRIKPIKLMIPHPVKKIVTQKSTRDHKWEIGLRNYPLNKIVADLINSGFSLIKNYRIFESFNHRMFVLEKVKL
jgi:ubiquinone/menaquinone biosynthesis C-methylase UbiE